MILLFKLIALIIIVLGVVLYIEEKLDIPLYYDKQKNEVSRRVDSIKNKENKIEDQLVEVLLMISSSLKAGRNLDQAFELVAISTPPPICDEFKTLIQERRLGVSIVDSLNNLAKRVKSSDLRLAVSATIFQQETGGNLEDLYTQIVSTVIERKRVMGKIMAGTAHAKLSGTLVGVLPLCIAFIIWLSNPDYLQPMFEFWAGRIALICCVLMAAFGLFAIHRMTSSILPDEKDVMVANNEANEYIVSIWNYIKKVLIPIIALDKLVAANFASEFYPKQYAEGKYLISASHLKYQITPEELLALREIFAIGFMILAFIVLSAPFGSVGWFLTALMCPVGFYLPRVYLVYLMHRRQRNIEFELPFVIDLLSLAIEAGLDLTGGIEKIVEKTPNTDIISEFKLFLSDIQIGKSMEIALKDMAERVNVLSFFSFVSALVQAQQLGADIGPTLRVQAEQMRNQRMMQTETKVNKLPVKLLFPLVFCVFPSLSVVLVGPALINVYKNMPVALSNGFEKAQTINVKEKKEIKNNSFDYKTEQKDNSNTEVSEKINQSNSDLKETNNNEVCDDNNLDMSIIIMPKYQDKKNNLASLSLTIEPQNEGK